MNGFNSESYRTAGDETTWIIFVCTGCFLLSDVCSDSGGGKIEDCLRLISVMRGWKVTEKWGIFKGAPEVGPIAFACRLSHF